ncbi:MAG: hypothetical protein K6A05_01960 [Lachnospiraceae bacterium]|nr:hypothetical protein [Lachnospiraceae bacterium]
MKEQKSIMYKRMLAILVAIILVCQLVAAFISSSGGRVKIESVQIDGRGAELSADLYYPAGSTSKDKYPAIVVIPGAGCTKEHMRSFAEELAKQDYVVLNLNAYGSGLSETPAYNDNDMGVEEYNIFGTPMGGLDAVNFVRTLKFVDATRIGITGHSQGSRRAGYTAIMDCGYYTFNDVMLNVLADQFGVTVAEADLSRDADDIAKEQLSDDGYTGYLVLKDEYQQDYDCMIKAMCLIGSTAEFVNPSQVVTVAGHDVVRNCKVNECVINGMYDFGYKGFNNGDTTKEAWFMDVAENIENGAYYYVDDVNASAAKVGTFRTDTIGSDSEIAAAIEARDLRMTLLTRETHSKNFFSKNTTSMVIDFFNQTLDNHADMVKTSTGSLHFMSREFMNFLAMIAMLAMIIPVAGLFLENEKYASVVADKKELEIGNSISKVVVPILTVVVGVVAIFITNKNKYPISFSPSTRLPLMITCWAPVGLLYWMAIFSILLILATALLNRKNAGFGTFLKQNLSVGVKGVGKTLLITVAFVLVAYVLMETCEYLFKQDFRYWMVAFGQLKANHWMYVLSYGLVMLPCFFILSLSLNYVSDKLMKGAEWKDILLTVVLNSVGIWGLCAVNAILAYSGAKTDDLFSTFILTYSTLLCIPVNVFILRKTYKMTNQVWLGVFLCSLLNGWMLVSVSGMNAMYIPQTWLSIFLGQ